MMIATRSARLASLLLCLSAGPVLGQEEGRREELDPEVVARALEDLEQAFSSEELTAEERAQAIQRNAITVHPDVIAFVARAWKDSEDAAVRAAAVEALRYMDHQAALEAIHERWRLDRKKLAKEPELAAAALRAMAQHGDESSIEFLSGDLFSVRHRDAVRARILGLGHIRSERSVEALMGIMKSARRSQVQGYMPDFRVALMVLTGADNGLSQEEWVSWWNENKKTLEVRDEPHLLPKQEQYGWNQYWGYDRMEARGTKREDRGDDPESDDPAALGPLTVVELAGDPLARLPLRSQAETLG